jgi:glutamine amidotransferase
MCELFAFSGEHPALVKYSLREFAARGGNGGNGDGWGIAQYVDGDVRLVKEAGQARDSACMQFIQSHPLHSDTVISHIRHATQGERGVRNSQPFVRELGGRMHVFAHNGDLDRAGLAAMFRGDGFRPVGDTDSELAFCILMERMVEDWRRGPAAPPPERRQAVVADFASELRRLGPANFLYADGELLFAHGHRRMHPGEGIRPPGLHWLCRDCMRSPGDFDARGLSIVSPRPSGAQTLVASVPLTASKAWRGFGEGEIMVVRQGRVLAMVAPIAAAGPRRERAVRQPRR